MGVPSAERFGHGKVDRYSDVIRAMQEDAAALVDWQRFTYHPSSDSDYHTHRVGHISVPTGGR